MKIDELDDPIALFHQWYADAEAGEPRNANAMAVASIGPDGRPSIRTVLMKEVDTRGFVFYTNLESQKGVELRARPMTAICFYWRSIGRQVRAEGDVTLVDPSEADAYFASRPRDSQIGAWASEQSRDRGDPGRLEARVAELEVEYENREVPRPPHWTGFRLAPHRIEFWHEQPSRLHDRLMYDRVDGAWRRRWLDP